MGGKDTHFCFTKSSVMSFSDAKEWVPHPEARKRKAGLERVAVPGLSRSAPSRTEGLLSL